VTLAENDFRNRLLYWSFGFAIAQLVRGMTGCDDSMTVCPIITSPWTTGHMASLASAANLEIPTFERAQLGKPLRGHDLWDMWPLQDHGGRPMSFDGWTVWMVLSAPLALDPDARHHKARIRLMSERGGTWQDHGNALPDGLNPGSREWAGSAIFDASQSRLTLFFTAAGVRGEASPSFAQRIFSTTAQLIVAHGNVEVKDWSTPVECIESDNQHYLKVGPHDGRPGFIKGFRDPAYFRDPKDGAEHLLFTGSLKQSGSSWNGCVGIARSAGTGDQWALLPPLISADGLNNELERPHIVFHADCYYLFWSTQRRTFAPGGPNGPNGLYGMVSEQVCGPYRPLNKSGLVAANPETAPFQAYSWWVTPDLSVHGFADLIDTYGLDVVDTPEWRRAHFGGVPAPIFHVVLDGDRAWVA
jgi:levansucrase